MFLKFFCQIEHKYEAVVVFKKYFLIIFYFLEVVVNFYQYFSWKTHEFRWLKSSYASQKKKYKKILFWRKKVQANLTIDFKAAVYNFREIFTQDFI